MTPDWQKNHIQIGELYREHGVKGYCKAFIYGGTDDNLKVRGKYVLVTTNGEPTEMQLEDIGVAGRYYLLKFDGIHSPEEALHWRKTGIWLAKTKLARASGEVFDYEWESVRVLSSDKIEIGTIKNVAYTPLKQFVVTNAKNAEFYVPYRPEWILSFDRQAKTVVMDLPEGITEL